MDHPSVSALKSVIADVRKLELLPPVYIYSITSGGNGISAVDIDQHNLHLAYSPGHSQDIYITLDHDPEEDLSGDLDDAWKKYVAAKNTKNNKRRTENYSGSSQTCVIPHGADVTGLCFTSDSNLLLSCGLDGTVKVWSVASLQPVEAYRGTSRGSTDIHVSTDSKLFAVNGHYQGCFPATFLYNFEDKDPISTFKGHTADIECIRFHPNGRYIATASCDKTVKLWCTQNFKEVRSFQVTDDYEGYPRKLAFSPDGNYLASAYYSSVKIWDLASAKMLKCLEIPNPSPPILNLCYNASGNLLATGGSNKSFHLWNVKNDSSGSSDVKPGGGFLKCDNLDKTVYCIKCTSNFFTCVTA